MCCLREKTFCADDRELMMFVCRWNNSNDEWFLGRLVQRESGLYCLYHFTFMPRMPRQSQKPMTNDDADDRLLDLLFFVCGNPEVNSRNRLAGLDTADQISARCHFRYASPQLMYAFLSPYS